MKPHLVVIDGDLAPESDPLMRPPGWTRDWMPAEYRRSSSPDTAQVDVANRPDQRILRLKPPPTDRFPGGDAA